MPEAVDRYVLAEGTAQVTMSTLFAPWMGRVAPWKLEIWDPYLCLIRRGRPLQQRARVLTLMKCRGEYMMQGSRL